MSESKVPVGETGLDLRTLEQVTTAGQVHTEVVAFTSPTDVTQVAEVTNATPADDAPGIVVRIPNADVQAIINMVSSVVAILGAGLPSQLGGADNDRLKVDLGASPDIDIGEVEQGAAGSEAWLVRDRLASRETLPDQTSTGSLLWFAFDEPVDYIWITPEGGDVRAEPGGVASATFGEFCNWGQRTELRCYESEVSVYAPVGTTVRVSGARASNGEVL